jgi:hypothetical protein
MTTNRLPNLLVLLVAACVAAAAVFTGCGSDSDDVAGVGAPDGSVVGDGGDGGGGGGEAGNPSCKPSGTQCAVDVDCCSSRCDSTTKKCLVDSATCSAAGTACTTSPECCTFSCAGGKCSSKQCTADTAACTQNEECCSGACTGGTCKALTTTCKSMGNPCAGNGDCCSKLCKGGFCASPSFCAQNGDACSSDLECCGGSCDKAAGAALGLCSAVGGAPCAPAGTVCTGSGCDNFCCSLSCGPSASGVNICQPPSGCKPQNELCKASEDCCGGPGRPTGHVNGGAGGYNPPKACTVPTGETFGRCEFLQCLRPGDVCKTSTFSCGGTSNDCCEGDLPDGGVPGPSFCNSNPEACCSQDALGIPRCRAVNFKCDPGTVVPVGQTCATSADCCGKPCVNLKCEGACVPTSGACTVNADCCSGLPCNVPTGSTKGTCGAPVTGGGDGGTSTCSAYGQQCSATSPCCNGVPCTGGVCVYGIK